MFSLPEWQILAEKELSQRGKPLPLWLNIRLKGTRSRPLYTQADLCNLVVGGSFPGQPPCVRDPLATVYTAQPWAIAQYAVFSTAGESNAFYRRNLAAGQKELSNAFELATHRGRDSDNPRVAGDVGKAGLLISYLSRLFASVSGKCLCRAEAA